MKRALRVILSLGACFALALPVPLVSAQDAKPAKHHKVRKKRARAARPPAPAKPSTKPAEKPDERNASKRARDTDRRAERPAPADAASAAQAAASNANAQIVKEGDTSVKVMSFEGLGIEGRLKSPQLVYFVQRVQAEFERPTLPHRSFIPELTASTAREPVR